MPTRKFTLNWYGAGISVRILLINLLFLVIIAGGCIALIMGVYGNVYDSEKRFLTDALQQLELQMRYQSSDDPEISLRLQQWSVVFNDPEMNILLFDKSGKLITSQNPIKKKFPELGTTSEFTWAEQIALRLFRIRPEEIKFFPANYENFLSTLQIQTMLALKDDDYILMFTRNIQMKDQAIRLTGYIRLDELTHAINFFQQLIIPAIWFFLMMGMIQAILLGQMISGPLRRLARQLQQIRLKPGTRLRVPQSVQSNTEISVLYEFIRDMLDTIRDASQNSKAIIEDFIHEIKNPLASIESAIQSIRKLKDPEKINLLMKIIEYDLRRIIRILHDVDALFAAGSEGNTYVTNFANVMLVPTLQAMVTHLNSQTQLENKQVKLRYVFDRDQIAIRANKFYFEQMLINLLGNAISFSSSGSEVVLQTITSADGKYVDIVIDDQGSGIPAGKLAKIFDRFYTDRENAPRTGEGMYHSGLGLSIAKQTASSLGGQIWAENRLNADRRIIGARFVVRLPLIDEK